MPLEGAEIDKPCDTGRYQDETAASTCKICVPGTYTPPLQQANAFCRSCEPNTYNPFSEQFLCTSCPLGKYNWRLASVSDVDCEDCLPCPPDHYATTWCNASNLQPECTRCTACVQNQYITGLCLSGSDRKCTNCSFCPAGSFRRSGTCVTIRDAQCDLCEPGKFSSQQGWQLSCTACPAGTYAAYSNATACLECPAGTYSSSEFASTTCLKCAAGSYTSSSGMSACDTCEAGSVALS